MPKKTNTKKSLLIYLVVIGCVFMLFYIFSPFKNLFGSKIEYDSTKIIQEGLLKNEIKDVKEEGELIEEKTDIALLPVTHIETPEKVKALYMSGWVAGSTDFRNSLVKIVDDTELNAVVIDVKDSTGRISFSMDDESIKKIGSAENRIKNIKELTNLLHSKNIYIIGRISVFQDPYLTKVKPEWAIKKISDGGVWKDRKGLSFLDPTNTEVHKYLLSIALGSYAVGFDEINLDYIRYPSDGNMKDINYNLKEGETRSDNIEKFFKYFSTELKKDNNIPLSGDLFGLTTEVKNDMGIGQVWEKAIPYFDFLCPMVYPSHYPAGHAGYKNPAAYPYEVIDRALKGAILKTETAGQNISKIRPWLQDFDMGATYTKELVKAEIKASLDNGMKSWMLWDPSNKYTPQALEIEKVN